MNELHILAGSVSLVSGAIALVARKGGALHRRSGQLFVLAMLLMGGSGAAMAASTGKLLSVIAGLLVVYLVATAWLALQGDGVAVRRGTLGLLLLGLAVVVLGGYAAFGTAAGATPAQRIPSLAFAGMALLGVAMDLRVLWRGPRQGAARLLRHLWRVSLAMAISTAAFFLGQPRFLPEPLRLIELRLLPVLLVFAVLLWWLWRLGWRRRLPGSVGRLAAERSGAAVQRR